MSRSSGYILRSTCWFVGGVESTTRDVVVLYAGLTELLDIVVSKPVTFAEQRHECE